MNEADTCRTYVLPKLKSAGWKDETISEQMVLTPGRILSIGDRHIRMTQFLSDAPLQSTKGEVYINKLEKEL